jgi:hypothetical protein
MQGATGDSLEIGRKTDFSASCEFRATDSCPGNLSPPELERFFHQFVVGLNLLRRANKAREAVERTCRSSGLPNKPSQSSQKRSQTLSSDSKAKEINAASQAERRSSDVDINAAARSSRDEDGYHTQNQTSISKRYISRMRCQRGHVLNEVDW